MKKMILAGALALLSSCSNNDASYEALRKAGFRNISLEGYAWMGCGEGDAFRTKFTATNPLDMRVSGVVCCGVWKGCTVRY